LIAAGVGDIVLVGSTNSASTLRIKEFLMRNGHPYSCIDLERDPDVQKREPSQSRCIHKWLKMGIFARIYIITKHVLEYSHV